MEQFFEHSDLGLGTLTFQKGPGTIHCWTGRIADTEILFSIILNTSELRSANLHFIRSVLQNWREYLSKAEHEIQAQIGKSPEKFGLQDVYKRQTSKRSSSSAGTCAPHFLRSSARVSCTAPSKFRMSSASDMICAQSGMKVPPF